VKKKALRPLHTPRDTFVHFTPHAPLPATPPLLKILAPKAYHWIARNCLRATTALQQHILYRQLRYTTRELAKMLLIMVFILITVYTLITVYIPPGLAFKKTNSQLLSAQHIVLLKQYHDLFVRARVLVRASK
jgi:hypothetical protein